MSSIQLKKTNQKKKKKQLPLILCPKNLPLSILAQFGPLPREPCQSLRFFLKKIVLLYLELLSSEDHIPIFKDAQLLCLERGD